MQTLAPIQGGKLTWTAADGGATGTLTASVLSTDEVERAFDRLAELKVASADYSMHLGEAWRAGLFRQLDNLLDVDEFDFTDDMPTVESFRTFLRLIIHNQVKRRPGLGATADGVIIASWTQDRDRLTVECLPNDTIRWVAVKYLGDGERISSASISKAAHLREFLAPFSPATWFG